jgi:hypothetical protein
MMVERRSAKSEFVALKSKLDNSISIQPPRKLPVVLSVEEVAELLASAPSTTVAYGIVFSDGR